jgi:hypothetical protein
MVAMIGEQSLTEVACSAAYPQAETMHPVTQL